MILLDINMPGKNGLQILRELRENGYQGNVIMLTCYDEFEYVRAALRGGANDYVLKSSMNESGLLDAVLHLDYQSQKFEHTAETSVKQEQYLRQKIAGFSFHETCELSFDTTDFCCMVNKIMDIEKAELRYLQKGMDFFYRSLISVLEQALHGEQESSILWYDRETIGIFVSFSHIASMQEKMIRMRKLILHIHEVIRNYFDLQLITGISDFCYGTDDIRKAWEQAVMILDRGFSNRGSIFYFNDYRANYEKQSKIYTELTEVEVKIKKLILESGVEEIKEGLQEYFEFIRVSRIISTSRIQEFCIEFLNLVYAKKKEWKEPDILNLIRQQETLEELETYVYRLLACVFPDHTDQNAGWLVQRACEYIKKQYHQDIGLSEIARYLQFSESYTSRIFNREMGMNIPAYIKQIRIERAEYLLLHTSKKIYEIAEETGYLSTTAFHIAFKKQTGVTPMDYRNQNKNNK